MGPVYTAPDADETKLLELTYKHQVCDFSSIPRPPGKALSALLLPSDDKANAECLGTWRVSP